MESNQIDQGVLRAGKGMEEEGEGWREGGMMTMRNMTRNIKQHMQQVRIWGGGEPSRIDMHRLH